MYISNLEENISEELKLAEEIWIAVGLISINALSPLEHLNAQIHILVGIDLPTPPIVLRRLLEWAIQGKVKFKVYTLEGTFFHPKVYIWRKGSVLKAYVGSGNMTNGGWKNNVELFWQIEKVLECHKLVNWFGVNMAMGIAIDEKFIKNYEMQVFKPSKDPSIAHRKRLRNFKINYESDYDFYFRKEDFDAFTHERAITDNLTAKQARKIVNRKLLALHYRIFPKLQEKGVDLHHHHKSQNIVSSFAHTARNSKTLNGMWLYYGKSPDEAAAHPAKNDTEKSMNNHVRLQLIIREDTVGIWCAVGKGGGSRIDRNYFQRKMEVEKNQQYFFSLLKTLGDEYFVELAGKQPYFLKDIKTPQQLFHIIVQDRGNLEYYFIIGMNVLPNDERLLDNRLESFVLKEFEKLFPVYNFFKAPVK
ncbi:phospholipase D family protein [Pedobacter roseus]|uniref:Phospholipase D family protein n=1 Tax=Pedobacter roseus TaxID=336820 RepID=A0A7G9QH77_9SPHI|nr:phospholipase D family protein [Pedobacter roseus]QNN42702.1 phospholipase D family protein [Pedobacter roseus]